MIKKGQFIYINKSCLILVYINVTGFVDMCVQHIPSPADNAQTKVENIYTGPTDTNLAQDMLNCDPEVSFSFVFIKRLLDL